MNIIEKQIKYNRTVRSIKPKFIVIHCTDNDDKTADAEMHYNYFNENKLDSSADVFIDENNIFVINDYTKYYTWHCGDGNGKYGITNSNSVGIEICINSGANWKNTYNNTLNYVYSLMKELSIGIENVVRHYDASRKRCPSVLAYSNWEGWTVFMNDLKILINSDKRDWKNIIKNSSVSNPDKWISNISVGIEIGKTNKNLEWLMYIPDLIVKLSN